MSSMMLCSHLSGLVMEINYAFLAFQTPNQMTVIPINILLDTFELPQSLQVKSINNQSLKKRYDEKDKS